MAAVTLLQTIFPKVMQQLPDQQLSLILLGRNPPQWLHDLVACTPHPRVTLTGTVDDVRPYLQHAAVVVAPLRIARGVQNKVLEAMSMGLPVVLTSGYSDPSQAATLGGTVGFLAKPWTPQDLLMALRTVLERD